MNHGSLFSGIGGFDLAAEWMGWNNTFHCEWNPFGQKILKHYWPNAIHYEDITQTDFTVHQGNIDIITGGYPCQPFSLAGKRKGTDDARYLWPEMLRCIREVRPRWVVGENVYGLVSWNDGLVFDTVCAQVENEGFQVLPIVLPAAGVNAPHKRDRIFFIAHATGQQSERMQSEQRKISQPEQREFRRNGSEMGRPGTYERFPTQSPVCHGDDGVSSRLDGIAFSAWRHESIKAGGNAVCPPLVFQLFQAIEQYENTNQYEPKFF